MSLEDPAPADPVTPARRRTISFDPGHLPSAGTAIGVGLLSAAVFVSAMHARSTFDIRVDGSSSGLDLAVYLIGVAAVLVLAGIAVAGLAVERITEPTVVSWPGAAAALGSGLMLGVLIDSGPEDLYAGAALTLTLSLTGLWITRAAPFVVTGLAALSLLYGQGFDDLVDFSELEGGDSFITVGAAITAFVIAVSVAGWFLRETPALTAVLTGIGGLVALVLLFQALAFTGLVSTSFDEASASMAEEYSSGEEFLCGMETNEDGSPVDEGAVEDCYEEQFEEGGFEEDFDSDLRVSDLFSPSGEVKRNLYIVLGFALLLAGFWTVFGMATGHVAFRILVAADVAIMIPAATMALVVEHPAWWEIALIVLGGLVLVIASGAVRRPRAPEPLNVTSA